MRAKSRRAASPAGEGAPASRASQSLAEPRGRLPMQRARVAARSQPCQLVDQAAQRGRHRERPAALEQALGHRQRGDRQVQHELVIGAEPGVVVPRAGRDQPGVAAVDALGHAVDRHQHLPVHAQHDLVEVMHVRGLGALVGAQRDRRGGEAGSHRKKGKRKGRASARERLGSRRMDLAGSRLDKAGLAPRPRPQTASSSTSNTRVAFGGITPPAPRAP